MTELITYVDDAKLQQTADQGAADYASGDPFPYAYFDDFFNGEALDDVLAEFPGAKREGWREFDRETEKKLASHSEELFGPKTKLFLRYLNSAPFLDFLGRLTGIENLIPDPYFSGGGLHQINPGGLLKVHSDFNKDERTGLDRRLNVLVYLNKDWEEAWGGHFELWDLEMKNAKVKMLPLFNRMAIFSTTSTSYHGHPDPLKCPEDRTRKSVALYYYTNGRPAHEVQDEHTTLFQVRPGGADEAARGQLESQKRVQLRRKLRSVVKSFVPPIVLGKWDPDRQFKH